MKQIITLIAVLIFSILNGQKTYVPDSLFEAYLETHAASGATVPIGAHNHMGDGIPNNDSECWLESVW